MKSLRIIIPAGLLGAITACSTTVAPSLPPTLEDTCNAAQYGHLIGQDATALEKVLLMGQVRVIRPGDAVTQDFRPDRINFGIDTDNRISDISCG